MSELIFEDTPVPAENLLGSEGGGITNMMRNFEIERLGSRDERRMKWRCST